MKRKKSIKTIICFLMSMIIFTSVATPSNEELLAGQKKQTKITLTKVVYNTYVNGSTPILLNKSKTSKSIKSKDIEYISSNKKIATVSPKGIIKGKHYGTTTITVRLKNNHKIKTSCKVKVYKATKKIALLSPKKCSLTKGKSIQLKAKIVSPKKGAQKIQWRSCNSKIVKVTSNGKVTGIREGYAKVIGTSGKKKVSVYITVKKAIKLKDNNGSGQVEYAANVKSKFGDIKSYEIIKNKTGGKSIKIKNSATTSKIKKGDYIVLPTTKDFDYNLPYHVKSVKKNGEFYILDGELPNNIFDIYDTISFSGKTKNFSFEAPTSSSLNTKQTTSNGIQISFSKNENSVTYEINNNFTLSIKLKDIEHCFNLSKSGLKQAKIILPAEVTVSGNIPGKDYFDSISKKLCVQIMDMPIPKTGLSFKLFLYPVMSATGSISIVCDMAVGYDYTKEKGLSNKSSFNIKNLEANGEFSIGGGLSGELYWLEDLEKLLGIDEPEPIYDFSVEAGAKSNIKTTAPVYPDTIICSDVSSYLFVDCSLAKKCFLGKHFPKLKATYKIVDEKNSPLKANYHFENLKKVANCCKTIKLHLVDCYDEDVSNAQIAIYKKENNTKLASGTSSSTGFFESERLAANCEYTIMISKNGYQNTTINYSLPYNYKKKVELSYVLKKITEAGNVIEHNNKIYIALQDKSKYGLCVFDTKNEKWSHLLKNYNIKSLAIYDNYIYCVESNYDNSILKVSLDGKVICRYRLAQNSQLYRGYYINHNTIYYMISETDNPYDCFYHLVKTDLNINELEYVKKDLYKPYICQVNNEPAYFEWSQIEVSYCNIDNSKEIATGSETYNDKSTIWKNDKYYFDNLDCILYKNDKKFIKLDNDKMLKMYQFVKGKYLVFTFEENEKYKHYILDISSKNSYTKTS